VTVIEEVLRFGEEEALDFEAGCWKKALLLLKRLRRRRGGLLIIRLFVN
jgi:hypothetical protein